MDRQRIEKALAEVRAGNREAFRAVVQETSVMLRTYIGFHLHDYDAANDVLQEIYVRVFLQVGRYRPGTDCVAWIKSVARYAALSARTAYVRERGHRGRYQLAVEDELGAVLAERDQAMPVEDRIPALRECMDGLTRRTRAVVEQYYFQGVALPVVAEKVGMTVNAVRVALHRARQFLAECVEEKGASA